MRVVLLGEFALLSGTDSEDPACDTNMYGAAPSTGRIDKRFPYISVHLRIFLLVWRHSVQFIMCAYIYSFQHDIARAFVCVHIYILCALRGTADPLENSLIRFCVLVGWTWVNVGCWVGLGVTLSLILGRFGGPGWSCGSLW